MTAAKLFQICVGAISDGKLIVRESSKDKEFHFQNWFSGRLSELGLSFECGGRNSYPDFRLVAETVGFEIKGLAYPGRWQNYDANSQVPSGWHNGRSIYYVFGRYPADPDGNNYPVVDLVVCHGDFLNAQHDYVHKNKSVKGFGTYGDIMIRDRKMYVVPTPFALANGTAHRQTLILPHDMKPGDGFKQVGTLVRKESKELIVSYEFDLRRNTLKAGKIPNPDAGKEHRFVAWRLQNAPSDAVTLNALDADEATIGTEDEE
jgi:hypothetical protein